MALAMARLRGCRQLCRKAFSTAVAAAEHGETQKMTMATARVAEARGSEHIPGAKTCFAAPAAAWQAQRTRARFARRVAPVPSAFMSTPHVEPGSCLFHRFLPLPLQISSIAHNLQVAAVNDALRVALRTNPHCIFFGEVSGRSRA